MDADEAWAALRQPPAPFTAQIRHAGGTTTLDVARGLDTQEHVMWHAFGPPGEMLPASFIVVFTGMPDGHTCMLMTFCDPFGVVRFTPRSAANQLNN